MSTVCPQCSAGWTEGSCQDAFDRALALEFTDATYGTVHHLTMTAYMLQHNRYSHAGWPAARSLLVAFLDGGLEPERARRHEVGEAPSITRGAPFARFDEIRWTRTIADVRMEDAQAYRADVEAWARSVMEDTASVTC